MSPCLFNLYAEYRASLIAQLVKNPPAMHILYNAGLGDSQAGFKMAGINIINNFIYMQMIPPLRQKVKKN